MRKKYIRLVGVISATIAPVAFLLSCSPASTKKIIEPQGGGTGNNNKKSYLNNIPKNAEGLYMHLKGYNGSIYDPNRQFNSKTEEWGNAKQEWVKIPEITGFDKSVIELAVTDSIYMIYNDNNSDGFSPDNFTKELSFNDSSMMNNDEVQKANQKMNATKKFGNEWDVLFVEETPTKGHSSKYIGSQSNHAKESFEEAMKEAKKALEAKQYQALENYYQKANKGFIPQVISNAFTYEKIAKNVFKITLVGNKPITAASFRLTKDDGTGSKKYGIYSITEADWSSYEGSQSDYSFLARHHNDLFKDDVLELPLSEQAKKDNIGVLPKETYNNLVNYLEKNKKKFEIVILSGDKVYFQSFDVSWDKKDLWGYLWLSHNRLAFESKTVATLGTWVGSYSLKWSESKKHYHGTSKNSNYGLKGYPMFLTNHELSQLGASNFHPSAGQIIEISYNHNA